MLTVLIRKDDATEIPRQVADIEAARALDSADMPVFVLEGGVKIPLAQYGLAKTDAPTIETEPGVGETQTPEAETLAPEAATPASGGDEPTLVDPLA